MVVGGGFVVVGVTVVLVVVGATVVVGAVVGVAVVVVGATVGWGAGREVVVVTWSVRGGLAGRGTTRVVDVLVVSARPAANSAGSISSEVVTAACRSALSGGVVVRVVDSASRRSCSPTAAAMAAYAVRQAAPITRRARRAG